MAIARDASALRESGRYKAALTSLQHSLDHREPTLEERVLQAELLCLTGAVDEAVSTGTQLLSRKGLNPAQKCRVRGSLGTALFRKGLHSKAIEQFENGIELALQHNDLLSECRLRVGLFRNQNHFVGPQQAAAKMTALRQKVLRLGEPAVAALYHLAVAELAAKLGLAPRGQRHLSAAKALLPTILDKSIHAEVKLAELALTALVGNVVPALELARELVPLAEETGSESALFGAMTNLGHLLLASGELEQAAEFLEAGLRRNTFGGDPEVALRDTLMELYLASDSMEGAEAQANEIERQLERTQTRGSFHGLWYLLTRIRWLYRLGNTDAGLALAFDALPRIERMADRNLLQRMKLLAAEGLGRLGRSAEGADLMAEAVTGNPDPPLEMLAESARVCAQLAAANYEDSAYDHFARAARIMRSLGNTTGERRVARDAEDLRSKFSGEIQAPSKPERPAEATTTEQTAGLLDLGAHAPILATEALSLLAETQSARSASIVTIDAKNSIECVGAFATPGAPSPLQTEEQTVTIRLGIYQDRHYEIRAVPCGSASARATLLSVERLVHASLALAHAREQERDRAALWPEPSPEHQLGLVCAAESMLDLVKTARRVANSNITVLITGETGTGKELFARALHQASPRQERVFLPFNCTTVPREVLDAQLFGYRRGAFTGAVDDAPGIIRSAAGGTLFLDEIGEMPADVQPKLLRFLESGEILPIGEARPIQVDVRIVAATNADLDKLVAAGKFREDLYYRLNVIRLRVPPLRERREEVPLLVDYFLDKYSTELQKPLIRVAEETLEYLVLYRWPGNVRQLANEMRRMVALAESGAVLMPEHLSAEIAASRRTIPASERQLEPTEVVVRIDQPVAAAMEHLERAMIGRALKMTRGNNEDAAKMLGVSRKGLYLKRLRFEI